MIILTKKSTGHTRVKVESLLPCSADRAWEAVQTTSLLLKITAPLVTIRPLAGESLPERWSTERPVTCRTYLFGFLPLGARTLQFERIDDQAREIQTRESDALISRWDHHMTFRPAGGESCWYSDEIEIEAGWLTPLVRTFAQFFYRHRHRRWHKVAKRLAAGRDN